MTSQVDILNNDRYVPVLDHGFCGLVDTMGSDAAVVQAARVSYGAGTKTVREDRGLIRYLVSHRHTSPIEMCEVKLHLRMPIFVARQWIRHRTASINEYSGRYSVMSDEFYSPDLDAIQPQSTTNKQGRAGDLDEAARVSAKALIDQTNAAAYDAYQTLVGEAGEDHPFGAEFPGVAREISRIVLPVSGYTEFYWKQNLLNLLHLLKLRMDDHAQAEIRAFAGAVHGLIQPLFPLVVEAWEDYVRGGVSLSRMELALVRELLSAADARGASIRLTGLVDAAGGESAYAATQGMNLREFRAFRERFAV